MRAAAAAARSGRRRRREVSERTGPGGEAAGLGKLAFAAGCREWRNGLLGRPGLVAVCPVLSEGRSSPGAEEHVFYSTENGRSESIPGGSDLRMEKCEASLPPLLPKEHIFLGFRRSHYTQ